MKPALEKSDVEEIVESVIADKVPSIIRNIVSEAEKKQFQNLKWITTVVGLLGTGGVALALQYFAENAVDSRIAERSIDIVDSIEMLGFLGKSLSIANSDSFAQADAVAVMTYLRSIRDKPEIRHSRQFITTLMQVTRSFVSAEKHASIDEIFEMYEKEILAEPSIVELLLHHFGQDIVGRDIFSESGTSYTNFAKLAREAKSANVPELGLLYRMLYVSKKTTPSSSALIEDYLQDSVFLDVVDRTYFFEWMLRMSKAENWVTRVTPQTFRIQTVINEFLVTYMDTISALYDLKGLAESMGMTESDLRDILTSGELDPDTVSQLSSMIANQIELKGRAESSL